MDKKVEHVIVKFLTNEADKEDLQLLAKWIQNPKNERLFFDYIKVNTVMHKAMSTYDVKSAKKKILRHLNQDKNIFYKYKGNTFFKYVAAASIILLISLTFIFNKDNPVVNEPIIVNNTIKIGTDKATLTLEDGTDITLQKGLSYVTNHIKSNGKMLIYSFRKLKTKTAKAEVAYNYLTIPRGGQYFVKLSDGTQVWLNSESKLKYPVTFVEGETRQVELIYGEAYFDVSSSENHNGMPFKVYHDKQEVEVLGTEFNIKAYKDETNIFTTLVEGKVLVSNEKAKRHLLPNEQSNINRNTNDIEVQTIDVYKEIAWKEGVFSFRRKPLSDIMNVLSRWYDMDVIFTQEHLKNERFNGTLGKNQSIEEILSAIKSTNIISNYEINDKTVILK